MVDAHALPTLLSLAALAALSVVVFGWRPMAKVPVPVKRRRDRR
jgi:hypothetical protein